MNLVDAPIAALSKRRTNEQNVRAPLKLGRTGEKLKVSTLNLAIVAQSCGVRQMPLENVGKSKTPPAFLRRSEVRRALGLSPKTFAQVEAAGELPPATTLGGQRLYGRASVEQWLARRGASLDN